MVIRVTITHLPLARGPKETLKLISTLEEGAGIVMAVTTVMKRAKENSDEEACEGYQQSNKELDCYGGFSVSPFFC